MAVASLPGHITVEVSRLALQGEGTYTGQVHTDTLVPHGSGRMEYCSILPGGGQSSGGDLKSYEGTWDWGCWHGPSGILQFRNGDSYIGSFHHNERHGQGLYMWADGRCYEGEFHHNQRHGQGTFTFSDGAVYQGDFLKGRRHGYGHYSFPNGNSYEGEWKEGHYDGYGIFKWKDGRVYRGEWKASKHHGYGKELDHLDQVVYEGTWADHKPMSGSRRTCACPAEILISNAPSYDDCSTLAGSVVEAAQHQQQLHQGPLPSVYQSQRRPMTQQAASRSTPLSMDSNVDPRPQPLREHNVYRGPNRTQHVYRFTPQTSSMPQELSEASRQPPSSRRPSALHAGAKRTSQGEQPALAPFEGLPQISALIQSQREALEKCNASHLRRKQEQYHEQPTCR